MADRRQKNPAPVPPRHIAASCEPHCRWCWGRLLGCVDDHGWMHERSRRWACEDGEHLAEPITTADQWRAKAQKRRRSVA